MSRTGPHGRRGIGGHVAGGLDYGEVAAGLSRALTNGWKSKAERSCHLILDFLKMKKLEKIRGQLQSIMVYFLYFPSTLIIVLLKVIVLRRAFKANGACNFSYSV